MNVWLEDEREYTFGLWIDSPLLWLLAACLYCTVPEFVVESFERAVEISLG